MDVKRIKEEAGERKSPTSVTSDTTLDVISSEETDASPARDQNGPNSRQVAKLRRFLSTLYQFSSDISPEIGARVRHLIVGLLCHTLSIEEFISSIQDVTNFPLRPFVIPFLEEHLPDLAVEIRNKADLKNQSPQQYLHLYEEIFPAMSWENQTIPKVNENGKRRLPDSCLMENGRFSPPLKRHLPIVVDSVLEGANSRKELEEEWKNIHVMLTCILSMVEKTKRALNILQDRTAGSPDAEWLAWLNRLASLPGNDIRKRASEAMSQTIRNTEERINEVKKRAEEAVSEVKRQALIELQRTVLAAESRTSDLISSEKSPLSRIIDEERKKTMESLTSQADLQENCWNCGRRASETCSGCNTARYCSTFCQHKDWDNHHRVCGTTLRKKEKTKPTTVSSNPSQEYNPDSMTK